MSDCTLCGATPVELDLGQDRGSFCAKHAVRVRLALEKGMRVAYPAKLIEARKMVKRVNTHDPMLPWTANSPSRGQQLNLFDGLPG